MAKQPTESPKRFWNRIIVVGVIMADGNVEELEARMLAAEMMSNG